MESETPASNDDAYQELDELWDCHLDGEELETYLTPLAEKWTDYLPSDGATKITIDESKEIQWGKAKEEIRHVREKLKKIIHGEDHTLAPDEQVSKDDITDFFLGSNSKIGQCLMKELEISEEEYCQFMATVCLQSAYKVSVTMLYDGFSKLKSSTVIEERDYLAIWKKLATKYKLAPNEVNNGRRGFCIWQHLQSIINTQLRALSVEDRAGKIGIALDDDKIWMSLPNLIHQDLFGLKYTTHNKANRKGIVAHTAVSTGCNIPLGVFFERKKDSAVTCFMEILDFLFNMDGETDLSSAELGSDRAYLIPKIVFNYVAPAGGDWAGTTMRSAQCWPFTFNQVLGANDNRTLIDPKGAPTLFLKYVKVGDKKVFASAFRNGSDSVATAVSSLHRGHHWEGVVLVPRELLKWRANRNSLRSLFFQRVPADIFDTEETGDEKVIMEYLLDEVIEPLTLRQGTADWHHMRRFSFTLSQAHTSFLKALPSFLDDENWVKVARYLYGPAWREHLSLQAVNEEAAAGAADAENGDEGADGPAVVDLSTYLQNYEYDEPDKNSDNSTFHALVLLKTFVHNTGEHDPTSNEELVLDVNGPGMVVSSKTAAKDLMKGTPKEVISKAILILKERIPPTQISSKKNAELELWLQKPNCVREYLFYSKTALNDALKSRSINVKRGVNLTINKCVEILAGLSDDDIQTEPVPMTGDQGLSSREAAIKSVLEHSFMPRQKGTEREHCSLGHRLELPILDTFCKETKNTLVFPGNLQVKGAYTAGLAGKRGKPYVKDSIDFIVTVLDGNLGLEDMEPWGFEAKGRVTANTVASELDFMDSVGRGKNERIHSSEAHEMLQKDSEHFQVMHHSYVYLFKKVIHAVANKSGHLIQSTVIDFETELLIAYGRVLRDLKNLTLCWAYDNWESRRPIAIPDDVLQVSERVRTINGTQTLQGALHLWKALCKLPGPVPSFKRLIPAICAYWNATKSGSDTTTKLIDDRALYIPYVNCESVACGRLIMLMFVVAHRLNQVVTADSNLPYPTLEHYRNAASKRTTFHRTLLNCEAYFFRKLEKLRTPPAELQNQPTRQPLSNITNTEQARRNPRRQRVFGVIPETVTFGAKLSFKTPKKITAKATATSEEEQHSEITKKCKGIPMKSFQATKQRCADLNCSNHTQWFCVTCKRFFCVDRSVLSKATELPTNTGLYCHEVRGKT